MINTLRNRLHGNSQTAYDMMNTPDSINQFNKEQRGQRADLETESRQSGQRADREQTESEQRADRADRADRAEQTEQTEQNSRQHQFLKSGFLHFQLEDDSHGTCCAPGALG